MVIVPPRHFVIVENPIVKKESGKEPLDVVRESCQEPSDA